MSYHSTLVESFPYRNAYRDMFLNAVDLADEVFDFSRGKKIHVNRAGRKNYIGHRFADGLIVSDETLVALENGLAVKIARHFKKPMTSKKYKELSRISQAGKMREKIKIYEGEVLGFDSLSELHQQTINDIFRQIFRAGIKLMPITPAAFHTEKTSFLNGFLKKLSHLKDQENEPDIYIDARLAAIPYLERPALPWIRRKDKKI